MDLKKLFHRTRTCRRFDESFHISTEILENMVELARLSASGGNKQPLKYLLFNTPEQCEKIFPFLAWAAYLKDWPGPVKGERPCAYIIVLGDRSLTENFGVDHGIAAQSIMLGATNEDLGGCIIASVKRNELAAAVNIPERFEILLVLAIGKPVENVVIEDVSNDDIKYWRDNQDTHHVPKRVLKDLIIKI